MATKRPADSADAGEPPPKRQKVCKSDEAQSPTTIDKKLDSVSLEGSSVKRQKVCQSSDVAQGTTQTSSNSLDAVPLAGKVQGQTQPETAANDIVSGGWGLPASFVPPPSAHEATPGGWGLPAGKAPDVRRTASVDEDLPPLGQQAAAPDATATGWGLPPGHEYQSVEQPPPSQAPGGWGIPAGQAQEGVDAQKLAAAALAGWGIQSGHEFECVEDQPEQPAEPSAEKGPSPPSAKPGPGTNTCAAADASDKPPPPVAAPAPNFASVGGKIRGFEGDNPQKSPVPPNPSDCDKTATTPDANTDYETIENSSYYCDEGMMEDAWDAESGSEEDVCFEDPRLIEEPTEEPEAMSESGDESSDDGETPTVKVVRHNIDDERMIQPGSLCRRVRSLPLEECG